MKIKTLLLFLIVLSVPFFAAAQNTLKLGHVNVQELVQKHPQMDSIRAIMDQESKDMQEIYDEMLTEHEKKLATFEAESETYSDFVKEAKQNELLELVQKIQNYNATAQQQMQKRNMELVQPLYQQINEAISSVAGTDKFTYVLDVSNGAVAYVSPESSDITVRVLEELQK